MLSAIERIGRSKYSLVSVLLLLFISLTVFRGIIFTPGAMVFEDINTPVNVGVWFRQMYPLWNDYGSHGFGPPFRLLLYAPVFYVASLFRVPASTLNKAFYVITPFAGGALTFFSINCVLRKSRKWTRAHTFLPVRKGPKRVEARCALWRTVSRARTHALASFTGAAVYMISPAILINQITHYFTWIPYYLQPLLFLSYVKTLEDGANRNVVLTALILAFASIGVHYVFFSWLLLLSWLGYSCLRCHTKQMILRSVKTTIKILLLYILFCSYWIVPLIMTPNQVGTLSSPPAIAYVQEQSRQNMFYNVVRLVGGYAYFPASHGGYASMPYTGILPTLCGFIIPLMVAVSIATNRKNKYVLFFSAVLAVSLYLAMGTMAPYPKFYEWLSTETPVSSLVRKPNKWLYFTSLSYSFILSIGVTEFSTRTIKKPFSRSGRSNERLKLLSISLIVLLSALTVVSIPVAHPLAFYGDFKGILTPIEIPRAFENVSLFLEKSDLGESKVLWLPTQVGTRITWNYGRYTEGGFYNQILDVPSIGPYSYCSEYLHFTYDTSIYSNKTAFLGKLLVPLNVKYIVFHDDFAWPGPLGGWNEYSIALSNLNTQKDLNLARQEDFLYVFKNEEETERFFIPSQVIVIDDLDDLNSLSFSPQFDPINVAVILNETEGFDFKGLPITPSNESNANGETPAKIVGYKRIDPTRYEVQVEAEKPFILAFAEPYTPGWKAYVDGKGVENIPLYSAINGFLVYTSGNLQITIEYSPQKWLNLGIAITTTTIVAGLIYLTKPNLAKSLKKSFKGLVSRLPHIPNLQLDKKQSHLETNKKNHSTYTLDTPSIDEEKYRTQKSLVKNSCSQP